MEHQNITLSIPKELLKKVKHIAIEKKHFGIGFIISDPGRYCGSGS